MSNKYEQRNEMNRRGLPAISSGLVNGLRDTRVHDQYMQIAAYLLKFVSECGHGCKVSKVDYPELASIVSSILFNFFRRKDVGQLASNSFSNSDTYQLKRPFPWPQCDRPISIALL